MAKRPRVEEAGPDDNPTPRKTRRGAHEDTKKATPAVGEETPSKRKSILRGTPVKSTGAPDSEVATPKSLRKVLFATPAKPAERAGEGTPTAVRNDRSARRKSLQALYRLDTVDQTSDDEDAGQNEAIAAQILDADADGSDEGDEEQDEVTVGEPVSAAEIPAKTARPRGRPKGKRRERTPSPPPDMPHHELYFFQNHAGGNKTSSNTLPAQLLLNHEDYFAQIGAYKDPHQRDVERLKRLHMRSFDQWMFELDEGFNLCLYGYGSKRNLVMEFAAHMHVEAETTRHVVVVNGYTPGLTIRDVLATLASVVLPKDTKLPAQPPAALEVLLATLSDLPPSAPVTLIIHSLDHANLRKPATQAQLAHLAAHPNISLLATCDTPNFALLWDITLTRQLRFLYHDATTFEPYKVEIDAVEEVNALLGRSGRRLGGRDGVGYVLKSLPENARNLFRILVAEQLALADVELDASISAVRQDDADSDDVLGMSDDEAAAQQQDTPSRRQRRGRPAVRKKSASAPSAKTSLAASAQHGVEYRALYHKAVEEFVCSSELSFRTLLKEFHDHQMVESRKDGAGTERLVVPFRREELEAMLEELV